MEKSLWLAVIMTAIDDLKSKTASVAEEARSWVFDAKNARDFKEVCILAGVEADAVRRQIRKAPAVPIAA